jgi:hypothetical protein
VRAASLCLVLVACSGSPQVQEPKPLVEAGGSCTATIECANKLHCSAGTCAEPTNDAERKAVEVARLERKIADTHRHEAKAFTEDGKRRMRKERAKLEAKLAELNRG